MAQGQRGKRLGLALVAGKGKFDQVLGAVIEGHHEGVGLQLAFDELPGQLQLLAEVGRAGEGLANLNEGLHMAGAAFLFLVRAGVGDG